MSRRIMHWIVSPLLMVIAAMICNDVRAADEPSSDTGFSLVLQPSFLQIPKEVALAECSAVAVNKKGEVYVLHRGPRPILCFDAVGKLVRTWGDDVIMTGHGLRVDRDDNVWVTDVAGHRVYKFDPLGSLLLALGTGEAGGAEDQFDRPTDIAFGLKDEVYVSDGYGNNRIMKFNQQGKFQLSWGTHGTKQGQFRLPHSVIVARDGRVLVGDRENDRIQVFDADGRWQATWGGFAPYGMAFDAEGRLFVADARADQVLLLDERGRIQTRWSIQGELKIDFQGPHMLDLDHHGNLYVAEVDGKRVQKLLRKKLPKP